MYVCMYIYIYRDMHAAYMYMSRIMFFHYLTAPVAIVSVKSPQAGRGSGSRRSAPSILYYTLYAMRYTQYTIHYTIL